MMSKSVSSKALRNKHMMDLFLEPGEVVDANDNYKVEYGTKIYRIGKLFSHTLWRTECEGDIFWSVQGTNFDGSAWIVTHYFGPAEEAERYQQQIILYHSTEPKLKVLYFSSCADSMNCIHISKNIMLHFKDVKNGFVFKFRIVKLKRNPYPQRML